MNKLMVIFTALCIAVPAIAMELADVKKELKISQQENDDFISHVSKAVDFNKRMVEKKKINEDNAIHVMLDGLFKDIAIHNNLAGMLQSDKYKAVYAQILDYQRNAHNQIMTHIMTHKDQIKIPLLEAYQFTTEYYLKEMCPQYKTMCYRAMRVSYFDQELCVHHFDKWAGGVIKEKVVDDFSVPGGKVSFQTYLQEEDRIEFMEKNVDYLKVDEDKKQECIDKYIAMILYQDIFAKQID